MEHFYVKFGDPSCIGFLGYYVEKQTDGPSAVKTRPTQLTSTWVFRLYVYNTLHDAQILQECSVNSALKWADDVLLRRATGRHNISTR